MHGMSGHASPVPLLPGREAEGRHSFLDYAACFASFFLKSAMLSPPQPACHLFPKHAASHANAMFHIVGIYYSFFTL